MRSLFLFHRDLRLEDNTGLLKALEESDEVICAFILDERQLRKNEFYNENIVQFMTESLQDLRGQIEAKGGKLYLFAGLSHEVVRELLPLVGAVYSNADYTPFAQLRDKQIAQVCQAHGVEFHQAHDSLLNAPGECVKDDGKPYTVFTPFYNKAMRIDVARPRRNEHVNYYSGDISHTKVSTCEMPAYQENHHLFLHGGRRGALKILENAKLFSDYPTQRDNPAIEKTTGLSAHNKFGTVSIREVYWKLADQLGMDHTLIKQLYWRDFLTHIAYFFPRVFGHAFDERFTRVRFENDEKKFSAWCKGQTGFPIVDAGMRQLAATGFMHNRVRMIVASFLVKDLHVDWRWGEKFFAQHLVDYDPAVNNGNWQWAASTGCDAQPYFRIFNPWLQQERFDADCAYVKRWIPELAHVEPGQLHTLFKIRPAQVPASYPSPIVDHSDAAAMAKAMFEEARLSAH